MVAAGIVALAAVYATTGPVFVVLAAGTVVAVRRRVARTASIR